MESNSNSVTAEQQADFLQVEEAFKSPGKVASETKEENEDTSTENSNVESEDESPEESHIGYEYDAPEQEAEELIPKSEMKKLIKEMEVEVANRVEIMTKYKDVLPKNTNSSLSSKELKKTVLNQKVPKHMSKKIGLMSEEELSGAFSMFEMMSEVKEKNTNSNVDELISPNKPIDISNSIKFLT